METVPESETVFLVSGFLSSHEETCTLLLLFTFYLALVYSIVACDVRYVMSYCQPRPFTSC